MTAERERLRSYICRNDPKLYRAIVDFERRDDLPKKLTMPTRDDLVLSRLQRAAANGFVDFSKAERRSVTGALSRAEKRKQKLNPYC
jgi:hypothetical protein